MAGSIIAFLQSLGVAGYFVVIVAALGIWNLKKLIVLRSPLDKPQHKGWRSTGGVTKPDHLTNHTRCDPK